MNTLYQKYAALLVNYSLELQKNERLLISSTYLAEPLLKEVYRSALAVGALPDIKIQINDTERILMEEGDDFQLKDISPLSRVPIAAYDALLNIKAPFNVKNLQSVPAERKRVFQEARTDINEIFMQRAAEGVLKWTLCQYPVDARAQESGMSLEEYERFVAQACYLDHEDPIGKWQEMHAFQEKIVQFLNTKKTICFQGPKTDISFSVKGRKWINSDGKHNMPSGEVFTSPVEDSVEGTIRFSFPGIYMGQEIEDISLEVVQGRVTSWKAKKGQELLDTLFEIPGTNYFGEVAIGTNQGIRTFTRNMLFDEKMGGTVHMALGASYPETGGKNKSPVHWDLLADMKQGGKILADGECIYQDGEFLL
jgi:aminopeptidase